MRRFLGLSVIAQVAQKTKLNQKQITELRHFHDAGDEKVMLLISALFWYYLDDESSG
jgi:hypothetical protein